jgi:hypothetical protein
VAIDLLIVLFAIIATGLVLWWFTKEPPLRCACRDVTLVEGGMPYDDGWTVHSVTACRPTPGYAT